MLAVIGLDGETKYLGWDRETYPYLVSVQWNEGEPLTFLVQSRDQRSTQVLAADTASLATRVVADDRDPEWVELVPGSPAWAGERFVMAADRDGVRRVLVDGTPITPTDLQVREIVSVEDDSVLVVASNVNEPTEQHVMRVAYDGTVTNVTSEPGVHNAVSGGGTLVVRSSTLTTAPRTWVSRDGKNEGDIRSLAESPLVEPNVELLCVGPRKLWAALLLPRFREPDRKYPVLLDPYGGPHHQTVMKARNAFLTSQWLADQGFAVLSIDGRGTPGRGSTWERAVHLDLAGPVLEDQVDALQLVAAEHPELDLDKVAIRGWSFGGYLAALAVLRRPDIFHAAVAGAPVTEWRLYDTHYTERYLGDPKENADVYDRSGLLGVATSLRRPLLLIHGLADDNVVAAHTLQMSRVLLEAGRSAQRPPALGRHPHDPARGRRGEHPPASGRLPPPIPRPLHRLTPPDPPERSRVAKRRQRLTRFAAREVTPRRACRDLRSLSISAATWCARRKTRVGAVATDHRMPTSMMRFWRRQSSSNRCGSVCGP